MQKNMYNKFSLTTAFSLLCLIFIFCFSLSAKAEIIANTEVIGTYTTKFDSPKSARGKNIKLAAEKMDCIVIEPGQEFSFNETVGPTTKANGFKLARVFIKGQDSEGYGGGVCQVSSTLYNAVLESGLEVTERHPHSKKVSYVPENMDATASYGGVDLKFNNNLDCPVVIRANTTKNEVTVTIEAVESFDFF